MKVIFNLEPSYSKTDVTAAQKLLLEKNPTKKEIYTSQNIKKAIAVAAIGENDPYGLYPIAKEIHAHYEKFYKLNHTDPEPVRANHSQIIEIQNRLANALELFIQDLGVSNLRYYGAALAFYPDTFDVDGKLTVISEMLTKEFGRFSDMAHTHIHISAPKSPLSYRFFFNMFREDDLIRFFNVSSNSALSKYLNGRSIPSPLSWGMLLLSSGFHPNFEVKPRIDERKNKSPLSQILFTTPQKMKGLLIPIELRYFHIAKVMESYSRATPHKKQILEQIKTWYSEGNTLEGYNTIDEILGALDNQKNLQPIFSKLIKAGLFSERLRFYLDAFSELTIDPKELTQLMSNVAPRSAENLYIGSNSNPYIYILLRSLFGGIENVTNTLDLSFDAWYKYEQSVRVSTSTVWTAMLLVMDIHPFYTLKKRKNTVKDKLVREVYQLLK